MQAESAVNAVATPTGAPTCPPCVASSAGLAQVSGAHEPGVLGSQPESPGPHASTLPPPVTRHPSCWHTCVWTHTPASHPGVHASPGVVSGAHTVLSGFLMWSAVHTPTPCALISQPGIVQGFGFTTPVQGSLLFGVHWPVAGLQPPLHSSVGHGVVVCDCTQTPFSHPGCVQRSLSVSLQPACVLSGFLMWPAVHTPTPCPLISQPDIVQGFGSATPVQG